MGIMDTKKELTQIAKVRMLEEAVAGRDSSHMLAQRLHVRRQLV